MVKKGIVDNFIVLFFKFVMGFVILKMVLFIYQGRINVEVIFRDFQLIVKQGLNERILCARVNSIYQ